MRVYRLSGYWMLAALGLAVWGWQEKPWLWWQPSAPTAQDWRLSKLAEAAVSRVYVLDQSRWTSFDLFPGQDTIRLITNATVPLSIVPKVPPPDKAARPWEYLITYQVQDAGGAVLLDRKYAFHTRVTAYLDAATGVPFTGGFYLTEPLVPADGKIVPVKLAGLPGEAARLRVRLISKEDPLVDVVARVYERQPISSFRLRYRWQRITEEKKRMLARSNVYSADLLTEREKINLLRNQWSAVAPMGVDGDDYLHRDLYVLREVEGSEIRGQVLPAGLALARDRRGLLPIPDPGGRIRLLFQSPGEAANPAAPGASVTIAWYGRGPLQRASRTVPWKVDASETVSFPGGLLEIAVPADTVIRAFLSPDTAPAPEAAPDAEPGPRKGETEITPEPAYLRTYLSENGAPVEFDLLHEGGAPAPFRIDLRRLVMAAAASATSAPAGDASVPVAYEWLDAGGKTLNRGELTANGPLSTYDGFLSEPEGGSASDPVTAFFALPADVARIRLVSAGPPVLLAAYDRPVGLPKRTLVPEDYLASGSNPDRQPGWFQLRASDYDRLSEDHRAPVLIVQSRPPVDDPDVKAGRYQWEEFRPQGPWQARPLLVPEEVSGVNRPEALPSTYREIPPGGETALSFRAPDGRGEVSPSLLFLSDAVAPLSIRVSVDGTPLPALQADGARGELLLPPLRVGTHRFQAAPSRSVRLFVNYVDAAGGEPRTLRLTNRIDSSGMEFSYDKRTAGDEMLSARLFLPQGQTGRVRVKVTVEPPAAATPGPYAAWTFPDRRFDVLPAGGEPVPVMGTASDAVDQGQRFFILLAGDVPPGPCRIRMKFDPAPAGYLLLTRITPGEHETRGFFMETESQ